MDLLISHKSKEVRDYINANFKNVNLHQIDWSPTSINTFMECVKIIESQDSKFDQFIFINGDTYIDNEESFAYTLSDMITNKVSITSAIIENFKCPINVFSSVEISQNNFIKKIFGDYVDTEVTLCDVVQFSIFDIQSFQKQK